MEASEQKAVATASSVPDALENCFGSEAQIEYVHTDGCAAHR
jgi:hypothetical protein